MMYGELPVALGPSLEDNRAALQQILRIPHSGDAKCRDFYVGGIDACLFFIDGMAGQMQIDSLILQPCRLFMGQIDCALAERADFCLRRILDGNDVILSDAIQEIAKQVLEGKTAVLVEGCAQAMIVETRNYEKRPVGKTIMESVVMGPQQGFVEHLRTNLTLIRRIIKSAQLTSEFHSIGSGLPTNLALVYLDGVCNPVVLDELRRRILSISPAVTASSVCGIVPTEY